MASSLSSPLRSYTVGFMSQFPQSNPLYLLQQLTLISNSIGLLVQQFDLAYPGVLTFATLPAKPCVGQTIPISDSTTTTWGATISGGGSNTVLAHWNGTNWTVAAK